MFLRLLLTFFFISLTIASPEGFGKSFGSGLVGVMANLTAVTILDYNTTQGNMGVLSHFWATGWNENVDVIWLDYYLDNEETPSISY